MNSSDPGSRGWKLPAPQTWDELWNRLPQFRRIWQVCTVIWGTAIRADAVIRVIMADIPCSASGMKPGKVRAVTGEER